MRARDLARPQHEVRTDAPAADAAALVARADVRAVLVVDPTGALVGVLSDSVLLHDLLPPYVDASEALAGVLEEGAADLLWRRLEGRRVVDLLPEDREEVPEVDGDATLIEVASLMVRANTPLVGVRDGDRLVGGISIAELLDHLLRR